MPFDWAAAGAVVSGLGSIFGKKKGPSPYEQSYGSIAGAIEAGAKYGLHPLASIGGAQGYSPAPTESPLDDLGIALSRLGQQKQDAQTRAKERELIDAQIAEARSRTLLNVSNSRRGFTGPVPGVTGVTGGLEAFDSAPPGASQPRGVDVRPETAQPATQTVTFGDKTMRGPNPEAFEIGIGELLAGLSIYGPQWIWQKYQDAAQKEAGPIDRDAYEPDYAAP